MQNQLPNVSKRNQAGLSVFLRIVATLSFVAFGVTHVASQQPPPTTPPPKNPAPLISNWHDATEFTIEGKGWTDTEYLYDRLPARAKGVVPDRVFALAGHSSGVLIRFLTDAPVVYTQWSLRHDALTLPIMSAGAASGLDLYGRPVGGVFRHINVGVPTQQAQNTSVFLTGNRAQELREYLLYLPTQNGITLLKIGVQDKYTIQDALQRPENKRRPIVYYGTSIIQGVASSRSGMTSTAILGRVLDRPIINLGFAGSANIEPELIKFINELDPAVFVIDALWNAYLLPPDVLASRLENAARTLRAAHPNTPILFVGQSVRDPNLVTGLEASALQKKLVERLIKSGVPLIFHLDGTKLLRADGEGTVDSVHLNDYGMISQATALRPVLERLLAISAAQK